MDLKQFNPFKVLNHWQTLNDIIANRNPYPVSCEIDPSNFCNHNCLWCINDEFRKANKTFIPTKLMFRIIREMAAHKVKSIAFTGGGEPLTNPAALDAICLARKYKMDVGLVTNGELLNNKKCRVIVDNCNYVRISLDAASEKTHRVVHDPLNKRVNVFNKIVQNIRAIVKMRNKLKKDITIGIGYLVSIHNYQEIAKAARLVKDIGVDYMQIRPAFLPGEQLSGKVSFETEKLIQEAVKLSDDKFYVFPILHRFDEVINLDRTYEKCLGHNLVGVVSANAKMYICCQLRGKDDFCIGDLKKNSFAEVWEGKKKKDVIKTINLDKCPPCRYNKYNEILDYLAKKTTPHKNFL